MKPYEDEMKAKLYAAVTDLAGKPISYWNLKWDHVALRIRHQRWDPKRRLFTFAPPHPCHENPVPTVFGREEQPDTDDQLGKLRARGYLASCFPEGDGISFEPPKGRTMEQVATDFRECFNFDVEVVRR